MRTNITLIFLFFVAAFASLAASAKDEGRIPIMQAGGETFTNVEVLEVSFTHVFFRHAGGISSAKLTDLSPDLQNRFGYDPVKSTEILNANQAATIAGSTNLNLLVNTSTRAVSYRSSSTNFVPPHGHLAKEYFLDKTNRLLLFFPNTWVDSCQHSPPGTPPALNIRMEPQSSSNFLVLISTLPATNELTQMGTRKVMEMVGNHARSSATESNLTLQTIRGPETGGYFFSITDKSLADHEPKLGSLKFKYQSQAMVTIDDFALYLSVLYNYPEDNAEKESLDMIANAHFLKE